MGGQLNTFQTILLFMLLPILVLALAITFLYVKLKDAVSWLLRFLTDRSSGEEKVKKKDFSQPISKHTELYKYAALGDADGFLKALNNLFAGALVEALTHKTPQNNTYLHIAAASKNKDLAVAILGVHPGLLFSQNKERDTPLHIAAKEGNKKVLEVLVDKENEIRGLAERLKRRLVTDAEENNGYPFFHGVQNNHGNTPLHEALVNGHAPVAMKLIEKNPTVANLFRMVNKEDKSPLYLAVEAGYVEIVKMMKEKAENRPFRPMRTLDDGVCSGKSPLQAAMLGRNKGKMLKILSSMKLEFSRPIEDEDKTPLHHAASTGYLNGVRSLLLQSTADAYKKDPNGIFPIHAAASKGNISIIQEFLKQCPDSAELLTTTGQNVLHVASKCGRDNVISYALKNPILRKLVNQQDNNGDTPLHLASKFRHAMVASTLTWDKRINVRLVNNDGFTALDVAEGNTDTATLFAGRLTWIALKSGGVQRAQDLHVLVNKTATNDLSQMPTPSSQSSNLDQTPQSSSSDSDQTLQSPNLDQMVGFQLGVGSKLADSESFKERVNTLLLVATLVVTVTFAAGFTMPGGYNSSDSNSQGMATMLAEVSFQIFVICDSIAMYSSIIVAVTLMWAQLGDVNLVISALALALPLLGIALTMMSAAFTAGVFVAVSNLHWLAGLVLGFGGLFTTIVISLFVPLFFPSQSMNLIVRYVTYYPFRLAVLASESYSGSSSLPPI